MMPNVCLGGYPLLLKRAVSVGFRVLQLRDIYKYM